MVQVDHGDVVQRRLVDAWVVVLRADEGERDLLETPGDAFRPELFDDRQWPAQTSRTVAQRSSTAVYSARLKETSLLIGRIPF